MIPLALQIKNFLSYGDLQTIDFRDYALICLSGKNGHGKSALLDAITWAIWGQARKITGSAKADQGLLRLGQTQMMVCFDFEYGRQTYRIRREFMQTYGKPVAILDFGLLDLAANKFISLTEKTIRDTQAKIEKMLHLTFDGFINSAFLRQGQANEFSKKTAKERKEILASILGLDQYESIRKRASDHSKQTSIHILNLGTLNTKIGEELENEAVITQKNNEIQQQLKSLLKQEEQFAVSHKKIEQESALLHADKQKIVSLKEQHQNLLDQKNQWHSTIRDLFLKWRSTHKQQLQHIDYSLLEKQKKECVDTIKNYQHRLQEQLSFKQELLILKEKSQNIQYEFQEKQTEQINSKKISIERLLAEKKHLGSLLGQFESALGQNQQDLLKCHNEQQQLQAQHLPNNSAKLIETEKQFEKRKEHYQKWIAQANALSAEITGIIKKNKLVQTQEAPACPLCEQNLSAARKRFLKNKFETDIVWLEYRLKKLTVVIKKLKIVLVDQHAQLQIIKNQQQQTEMITLKLEENGKNLSKYHNQALEISASITKHKELMAILETTISHEQASLDQLIVRKKEELEHNDSYKKVYEKIRALENSLAQHSYDKKAHETSMDQMAYIEKQLMLRDQTSQIENLQAQRKQDINQLCKNLKLLKKQLTTLESLLQKQESLASKEQMLMQQKNILDASIYELTKQKEFLLHQKGSLENQQMRFDQIRITYAQQQKQLSRLHDTLNDYQAIVQATGKDGIQALLIEDAIPEIEQETNELLAKLTDNQTQLFIESLRDLKKGGTKETLDIKISDAIGIRPYELFSGGEAFRIDFALRIAISKLLARRAGTSLQTLIIDEGFGSQDEEGLAHIMDALYKIQDDFAKIIIVSHLNSMKNQFPVHFFIQKGPTGSMVTIQEQG